MIPSVGEDDTGVGMVKKSEKLYFTCCFQRNIDTSHKVGAFFLIYNTTFLTLTGIETYSSRVPLVKTGFASSMLEEIERSMVPGIA